MLGAFLTKFQCKSRRRGAISEIRLGPLFGQISPQLARPSFDANREEGARFRRLVARSVFGQISTQITKGRRDFGGSSWSPLRPNFHANRDEGARFGWFVSWRFVDQISMQITKEGRDFGDSSWTTFWPNFPAARATELRRKSRRRGAISEVGCSERFWPNFHANHEGEARFWRFVLEPSSAKFPCKSR